MCRVHDVANGSAQKKYKSDQEWINRNRSKKMNRRVEWIGMGHSTEECYPSLSLSWYHVLYFPPTPLFNNIINVMNSYVSLQFKYSDVSYIHLQVAFRHKVVSSNTYMCCICRTVIYPVHGVVYSCLGTTGRGQFVERSPAPPWMN